MTKTEEAWLHGVCNSGSLCYGEDGNKVKVVESAGPATKFTSMIRSRADRHLNNGRWTNRAILWGGYPSGVFQRWWGSSHEENCDERGNRAGTVNSKSYRALGCFYLSGLAPVPSWLQSVWWNTHYTLCIPVWEKGNEKGRGITDPSVFKAFTWKYLLEVLSLVPAILSPITSNQNYCFLGTLSIQKDQRTLANRKGGMRIDRQWVDADTLKSFPENSHFPEAFLEWSNWV